MPDDDIPDAPRPVAGESSANMSASSRPPESGDQPASHVETSISRPTTRTPRTRRRHPLSSTIHKIRNEARDNILATVGVVAALIALFPLAWSISDWFGAEPIRIESSPIAFSSGQFTSPNLVIPRPLAELERPPNYGRQPETFMDWAQEKGAVFADEVALSFVVKSDMDEPTYLVGARVTVLRRDAPMKGTWIAPDGAGPKADRLLFVNLDTSPPELTKEIGWDFPLEVSKADAELLPSSRGRPTATAFGNWNLIF